MAEGQPAVKIMKKSKKKKSLKSESQAEGAAETAVTTVANGTSEQPAPTKEKKKNKSGTAKHVEGEDSKKVKKRKRESLAAEESEQAAADGIAVMLQQGAPETPTPSSKESKKKKKKKQRLSEQHENGEVAAIVSEDQPKKKKSKKIKAAEDKENGISHVLVSPVPVDEPVGMQTPATAPGALESTVAPTDGEVKKDKKKKKKSKKYKVDDEAVCAADAVVAEPEAPEATTPMLGNEDITVEPATEDAEPYDEHADEEWAEEEQLPVNRSFRRVKSEEWLGKKGSMKNSYEATFGAGGWGHKAQQVLGAVRGKGFRHEKTKKKRGSYMGGKIDDSARASFKYDSD